MSKPTKKQIELLNKFGYDGPMPENNHEAGNLLWKLRNPYDAQKREAKEVTPKLPPYTDFPADKFEEALKRQDERLKQMLRNLDEINTTLRKLMKDDGGFKSIEQIAQEEN